MTQRVVNFESLAAVPPRSLYSYLDAQGWSWVEAYGNGGDVYGLPESGVEVLVPSVALADYGRRVADLLETLAEAESRDWRSVMRDIGLTGYDLVRVGLLDVAGDGSVPVGYGVDRFGASRQLLLSAACSEVRSQKAFVRPGAIARAAKYMDSVRLGQTEQGSFVISLLSPVPPPLDQGQLDLETRQLPAPFSRRVIEKLVSGLREVRQALTEVNRGQDILAFESRVNLGVSANLCDAVVDLVGESPDSVVDVSVSWASVRSVSGGRVQNRFTGADRELLQEASRTLKARQEHIGERIEGYVKSLNRERVEHEGRVTIKGVVEGVLSSVRVDFQPAEYSRALDAHDRRLVVSLEGDLRRDGHGWVMSNPRGLELHEDDDDE